MTMDAGGREMAGVAVVVAVVVVAVGEEVH